MIVGGRLALAWLLFAAIAIGVGCGCTEKPFLANGDARSAEVGYSRDLGAATAVAREHCARYEKVPRYLDSAENVAFFACEQP